MLVGDHHVGVEVAERALAVNAGSAGEVPDGTRGIHGGVAGVGRKRAAAGTLLQVRHAALLTSDRADLVACESQELPRTIDGGLRFGEADMLRGEGRHALLRHDRALLARDLVVFRDHLQRDPDRAAGNAAAEDGIARKQVERRLPPVAAGRFAAAQYFHRERPVSGHEELLEPDVVGAAAAQTQRVPGIQDLDLLTPN